MSKMEIVFLKMNGQFYGINDYFHNICKKKCIALYGRKPEYVEVVTLNTVFPGLLQRHMTNYRKKARREGAFNKGNPVLGIGRFRALGETQVCQHHCQMWYIFPDCGASLLSWLVICCSYF